MCRFHIALLSENAHVYRSMSVSDAKAVQKVVLLTLKSFSNPEGFDEAERTLEIGCIKSSIQTKKVRDVKK